MHVYGVFACLRVCTICTHDAVFTSDHSSGMLIPLHDLNVQTYHLARKSLVHEWLPCQQICGVAAFPHRNAQRETNKLPIAAGTYKGK